MVQVQILESEEGLAQRLGRVAPARLTVPFQLLPPGSHEACPHLLCIAPGGGAAPLPPACGTLLLPGSLSPLARQVKADCAVSYGVSPKDTLTFSWVDHGQVGISLQRELVTLGQGTVERQELCFPFSGDRPSLSLLAWVGLLLLLGVPPEDAAAPDA